MLASRGAEKLCDAGYPQDEASEEVHGSAEECIQC